MTKNKCVDCGQEYDNGLGSCPNCGCPTTNQNMNIYKCPDCGQVYDNTHVTCPNCGCPTSRQFGQTQQVTELSHSNAQQNKKQYNKKILITILSSMIIVGIVAVRSVWYFEHSYKAKIARFEKKAKEFKATLPPDSQIIEEIIDSVAQKVYYIEKNIDDYEVYGAPFHRFFVHDYATNKTEPVLPFSGSVDEYKLCGTEFIDSKLIEDRLFFAVHSNCMWRLDATGVFYVNIRDNSLHFVESCDKAIFCGNDEISIQKYYYLGTRGGGIHESSDCKEYNLSPMLSDEAYASNRKEQKVIEECLQKEWFERRKEEEIREVKSWLIGSWQWTGYILGQRVWARLDISDDYIVASSIYGIDDQGQYSIDVDNQTIHYGNYSYAKYDKRKKIYADEGEPYRKVSNTPSFLTKSTSNSYNSSSSSNNGNSIVKQLEKLDEKESRLIDEGNKAVRSGRADVALLKVFKMKDINSERIRLARQSGDSDLVLYYESKKNRSESIIRQWGFN